MDRMTIKEILEATGGRLLQGSEKTPVKNLVIDSRKIEAGDLFIPFRGERTDGHRFLASAFEAGAAACLTETEQVQVPAGKPLVLIGDSRKALQDIGAYYRRRLSLTIVGVTGSVGKTSTREMVSRALSAGFRVCATHGNYNGQLGVPITLGQITEYSGKRADDAACQITEHPGKRADDAVCRITEHPEKHAGNTSCRVETEKQAAVLEMGMSLPGEMGIISRIARVNVAVVTNIGISHIESLGSRDRICQEKLHITDGMEPDGLLVLNGDDDMLRKYGPGQPFRKVWYGMGEDCDYRAVDVCTEENRAVFRIVRNGRKYPIRLNVPGMHNVMNSLAAVAVAHELGVPMEQAVEAVESFHGFSRRLEFLEAGGLKLIDDSYNACPDSMKAALQVLDSVECRGKRIAVLADMWELGPDSPKFHYETGVFGGSLGIREYLMIGERAREIGRGVEETCPDAHVRYFMDNEAAAAVLKEIAGPEDLILLKGSNGMHLNEIVEELGKK